MIVTERLILRPIMMEDAEDMFEYAIDEEVTKYITWDPHESLDVTRATIQDFFLSREEKGLLPSFAVVIKETNKMIGTCDTVGIINRFGSVEIGYTLNRNYWGKGYATEATRALCTYLFKEIGVRRIEIRHHPDNIGSRRVIEKCGFVKDGVSRKCMRFGDEYVDIPMYSLFEEELK